MPSAELVGRGDVLALAQRRWEAASSGHGGMLLIGGEAGIGKSRVLAEIAARAGSAPAVRAAAWPRDAESAGSLLLDLAAGLRRAASSASELRAAGDALSTRLTGTDALSDDGARGRRRLIGDVTELLLDTVATTRLLLVLDDLHWADELSLEVLLRVAGELASTHGLLIAAYRSDEMPAGTPAAVWRARLLQTRTGEEARLPRLDADGTARLVAHLTGSVPPTAWTARLQERSNGIPLHIEELVAAGEAQGVPETLAQAVLLRADELDAPARAVAEAAAVLCRAVDERLLGEVAQQGRDDVDAALVQLRDRHFLIATDAQATAFDFRHALIRDAIYERIPPGRRRDLHARAARAGAQAGLTDAELSDHFEHAGLHDEAFRYAVVAADAARRADAHLEAAALFARAVRTAPAALATVERAELHSHYGRELALIDDNAGAAPELELAIRHFLEVGEVDRAADHIPDLVGVRHVLGEPLEERVARAQEGLRLLDERTADGGARRVRSRLHAAIAAAYMLGRRLEESIAEAEQGLDLSDDVADDVDLRATLGSVLAFAGRGDEGWAMLERAIDEGIAAGPDLEVPTARAYRMIGSSASVLVEYDRAEAWLDAGMAMTRAAEIWNDFHYLRAHRGHVRWATGSPGATEDAAQAIADGGSRTTEITALHVLGYAALGRDDPATALRHLERARELGAAMNELQRVSPALWGLAETALVEDRIADAVELTAEAAARSAEVADAAYLFPHIVTGVRARLRARSTSDAAAWLDETGALLRRRGIPGTLPALDHAQGLIAYARRSTTEARELLERARDAWDSRRRFWEGTSVRLDLARVARRSRRPGEEAALLAEVRERADAADAPLFTRLAGAQAASPGSGRPSSGPLTARELDVARLVAEGATNREIAERLVVAPTTVSTHVEHILAKLGAARRSEIAAWVARSRSPMG